jgi:hypothetical protein
VYKALLPEEKSYTEVFCMLSWIWKDS